MNDIKKMIEIAKDEYAFLSKIKEETEKHMLGAPQGSLNIATHKGRVQNYQYDCVTGERRYLKKSESELIRKLAQKEYEKSILTNICSKLYFLEKLIKAYATGYKGIYDNLDDDRKSIVIPVVSSDEEFVADWYNSHPGTSMIGSVYVGERDRCALRTLLRTAFEYSIIMNLAMCLILLLCAGKIIPMFFTGDIASTNMAIHAFRMFCLSMVFYSVNVTFRNFFQATQNQLVVYVYVITNNFLAILLSALVLNLLFSLNGVWMAYLAGEIITLFGFFVISQISGKASRKDADVLERMLMLPDSFDRDVLDYRYYSVSNMNELMEVSEKSKEYLESEGADSKMAYHLGLAIEEVGKNIIEYGFTEKKQQWIDVKIIKMNSGWEIHIRDDCQLFNPVEYIKNYNSDDSSKNIGLHLVNEISKSMEYTSTLKTNKLVIKI